MIPNLKKIGYWDLYLCMNKCSFFLRVRGYNFTHIYMASYRLTFHLNLLFVSIHLHVPSCFQNVSNGRMRGPSQSVQQCWADAKDPMVQKMASTDVAAWISCARAAAIGWAPIVNNAGLPVANHRASRGRNTKIVLNVSGRRFETYKRTLER